MPAFDKAFALLGAPCCVDGTPLLFLSQVLEDQKINKARRKWQKQTEFLCTIKFRNSLPDPPLGPHFLEVPLDLGKYVKYKPTTLDSDYKWKVHMRFCFCRRACRRRNLSFRCCYWLMVWVRAKDIPCSFFLRCGPPTVCTWESPRLACLVSC